MGPGKQRRKTAARKAKQREARRTANERSRRRSPFMGRYQPDLVTGPALAVAAAAMLLGKR